MSIASGQWSGKYPRSTNDNGAKIIAPNGSVISRNSGYETVGSRSSKTGSATRKQSVQGSIISHTKSETVKSRSGKVGSVVSGVSSQVQRKKRRNLYENESKSSKERAMSVTSLDRRKSYDSQKIAMQLKRYSQSDITLAIRTEIQSMTKEERSILLNIMDKYKKQQNAEKRREMAINKKIKEIQALRPPYSEFQSNICYICQSSFWPIIFVKHSCSRCKIYVCKNCLKPYKNDFVCTQCFQEMIYLTKSDVLFKKRKLNEDSDTEEDIDVDTIKRIITQSDKNDAQSEYSGLDEVEGASKGGESSSSILKRIFHKKKDDSGSLVKSQSNLTINRTDYYEIQDDKSTKSLSQVKSQSKVSSHHSENDYRGDGSLSKKSEITAENHFYENTEFHLMRKGEIMIGLSYNFNTEEFRVLIKKCRNLEAAIKHSKSSNPYVKIEFMPQLETERSYKTKVISSNLNPEFNEQFKFKHTKYDDIIARTILVSVWHGESLGKHIFLGQVILKLGDFSLEDGTPFWYQLKDIPTSSMHPNLSKYYGDIQFQIKYSTASSSAVSADSDVYEGSNISVSAGTITLWLKKANNLLTSSYINLPSSYAKCLLIPKTFNVPAKKSQIIRKNFNPMWNIPFTFTNIPRHELAGVGIEITIWDKRMGLLKDAFLGGVSLNISKNNIPVPNTEREVWQQMMNKPGTWIEAKLNLRKDVK